MMVIGKATVDLFKGVKFGAGFQSTPGGIRPSAALIYTYANPDWLVIAMPRVDLSKNANIEGFGIVEYKPEINDKWRFYSRLQGTMFMRCLPICTPEVIFAQEQELPSKNSHSGSEPIWNIGPLKHNENNIGGFLQVALF